MYFRIISLIFEISTVDSRVFVVKSICILILNEDWVNKDTLFKPNINCLSVSNENELYDILEGNTTFDKDLIIKNAKLILNDH